MNGDNRSLDKQVCFKKGLKRIEGEETCSCCRAVSTELRAWLFPMLEMVDVEAGGPLLGSLQIAEGLRLVFRTLLGAHTYLLEQQTSLTDAQDQLGVATYAESVGDVPDFSSPNRLLGVPEQGKGSGACRRINTSWCSDVVTLVNYCTLDLEYLTIKCRPYYQVRKFTSSALSAVYIPAHVEVKSALDEVHNATNSFETEYPEALLIVASDFNQAKLKNVLPKYYQHISRPTRSPNSLDHCYATNIPLPCFGKSDHYTCSSSQLKEIKASEAFKSGNPDLYRKS
eukprot:g41762.t1